MATIFCKTCGGNRTLHTPELWAIHKRMREQYEKLLREYARYMKKAHKKMLARTSK